MEFAVIILSIASIIQTVWMVRMHYRQRVLARIVVAMLEHLPFEEETQVNLLTALTEAT